MENAMAISPEYMHKLDLPQLDEILSDEGKSELLVGNETPLYKQYHPSGLVKPEWLNWAGIEWDFVNFFYKNNHNGILHVDGPGVWGINWIYNGYGIMEYWLPEDIEELPTEHDSIGSKRTICIAKKNPVKIYKTLPGAYLTNASVPHRPSGFDGRYAFSLRCYSKTITWDEAVAKFQHLFI
jgi:hypothetical protein